MRLEGDDAPLATVAEEAAAAAPAASAAPLLLPGLPGGDGLIDFLASALQELEEAQGGEDEEARSLLSQLEAQLAGQRTGRQQATPLRDAVARQQPGGPLADLDLEIASQIDSLTAQLAAVEAQFAEMGEDARRLVCAGTSVWMGGEAAGPSAAAGGAAAAGEAVAAAGEAAATPEAGSSGEGSAGCSASAAEGEADEMHVGGKSTDTSGAVEAPAATAVTRPSGCTPPPPSGNQTG